MEGTLYRDGDQSGTIGYDGQFAYYIALNPAGAASRLDYPAYRYQRILYPLLAWLFSLGGWAALLPWALLGVNLLAVALSAGLLGGLLAGYGLPPWLAVAFVLFAGPLIALRADLNEPLAVLFVLLGLLAARREQWGWAGLAFALAVLAKETALPFVLGLAAWLLFARRARPALLVLLVSLAPALIWGLLLTRWLGHSPLSTQAAELEKLPFYGLGFVAMSPAKAFILLWVAFPAVLLGLAGLYELWRRRSTPEAWLLLANAGLLAFMPRLTWINLAGALRAATGLCLASLLYAGAARPKLLPWLAAFWMVSGLILIPFVI